MANIAKPAVASTKKTISRTEGINLIKSSGGKFVTVTVVKNGTTHTINGRLGVSKGVKGTGKNVNIGEMGYIRLYTNKTGNWRLADTRCMTALKANKCEYKIK